MPAVPHTVMFACVHNAGRSQIAAAFFNALADPHKARAVSAGTQPGDRVHDVVIDAMREIGIDLTAAVPRLLTHELARGATWLVTMGCGDACPVFPGKRGPAARRIENDADIIDVIALLRLNYDRATG